jgi:hypothetical protein
VAVAARVPALFPLAVGQLLPAVSRDEHASPGTATRISSSQTRDITPDDGELWQYW